MLRFSHVIGTASSGIFVQEEIYSAFVLAMIQSVKDTNIGSYEQDDRPYPFRPIDQGPQVDKIQVMKVMDYIDKGKEEGATLSLRGHRYGHKVAVSKISFFFANLCTSNSTCSLLLFYAGILY